MSVPVRFENPLIKIIKENKIISKRSLGQNFMVDEYFLKFMIQKMNINNEDTVIEIGTGTGNLTRPLAADVKKVISFELDRKLYDLSLKLLEDLGNVTVINDKAENAPSYIDKQKNMKIVGNLPFSGYRKILLRLLETYNNCDFYVTIQKDVFKKMKADTGERDFCPLSVIFLYMASLSFISNVRRKCFYPQPKVDCVFIKIKPKGVRLNHDIFAVENALKQIFSYRGRKLSNFVKHSGLSLDQEITTKRIEQIEPSSLIKIAELFLSMHAKMA